MTVKPPHERSYLPTVTVQVMMVEEVGGPGDGTDVSWLLITSLPIDTYADVLRILDYYVARWIIEVFFRILKTGCRVVTKQPLPTKPPQLAEFMKLLTQLGGYNNRATEAPPGPQPFWIGIRRMLDFARAWLAFGPEAEEPRCV